jgi:hypothetical protein
MSQFQNSFRYFSSSNCRLHHETKMLYFLRKRKRKEAEMKELQRERANIQYQATLEHFRRLRQFKLQQIQTIQLLPACK